MADRLAELKAQRDALNAEINLIEGAISKAAYDGSMATQLAAVNDARKALGKSPLTMSGWLADVDEADDGGV